MAELEPSLQLLLPLLIPLLLLLLLPPLLLLLLPPLLPLGLGLVPIASRGGLTRAGLAGICGLSAGFAMAEEGNEEDRMSASGPMRSALGFLALGFLALGFSTLGFSTLGFSALGFSALGCSALGFSALGFSALGFSGRIRVA